MIIQKRIPNTLFLLAFVASAQAQLTVPTHISDHMVLQQQTNAPIWGWGNANETIKLVGSWAPNDTATVKVNNQGKWQTTLNTIEAGGPYTLDIIGSSKLSFNDVMLGEVWLCSGQSNMEWSHKHTIFNAAQEVKAANHPNIRIFHIPKRGAETLQNHCDATWERCTPETMAKTSAVGYFFAREIQAHLDVPVGIVVAAWGGTPAEPWTPADLILADPELAAIHSGNERPSWPNKAGVLYNQMINPVVPMAMQGVLWYQGESNHTYPESYGNLFKTMIEGWRTNFKQELPFYFVQIAPHTYKESENAAKLREQQEWVWRQVPQTGMVVVSDLVDDIKDIHPRNKLDVGKRLAAFALNERYGKLSTAYRSPRFGSAIFEKGKAIVTFEFAEGGIESKGKVVEGITLAGRDGVFHAATAKVESNGTLTVVSKAVKEPVAVRYCFDATTIGNLFSKSGLPVAPFRSDR